MVMVWCQLVWSADATLEVVKGVESLASLGIEDGSVQPGEASQKFAKMLAADMNVVSLFTVDERYAAVAFESPLPSTVHKDAQYILRYRLKHDGAGGMHADVKLLQSNQELFAKSYVLKQSEMLVFLAHCKPYTTAPTNRPNASRVPEFLGSPTVLTDCISKKPNTFRMNGMMMAKTKARTATETVFAIRNPFQERSL